MTLSVLAGIQKPGADSVTLHMTTQTPLYTGGIGQWGDQVHPSGLLGSLRHFSCLVARTLGDAEFEKAVWGEAGASQADTHAKRVALHWDTSNLHRVVLPERLLFPREDKEKSTRGWYFNQAKQGTLKLTLIRRGISNTHWNLLLLALRIQTRHATLGAKDQFGLGVLACDSLPKVSPLNESTAYSSTGFNLQRCAFGGLVLRRPLRNFDDFNRNRELALRLGLSCRIALRDALRPSSDASTTEQDKWKRIRHRLMGSMNECGSAVNVSAAYAPEDGGNAAEIRLFVQLRLDDGAERMEVMKRFGPALAKVEVDGWGANPVQWEYGGSFGGLKHQGKWLNKLAGLSL